MNDQKTKTPIETEWDFRREEGIAMQLDGKGEPTPEQITIAENQADDAIENLVFAGT